MVFGLEVVEEGSLAHVGGFGNVFDGDVLEAVLGKELKCATEEAQAGRGGAALAASGAEVWLRSWRCGERGADRRERFLICD